jgi:hypothetical protein
MIPEDGLVQSPGRVGEAVDDPFLNNGVPLDVAVRAANMAAVSSLKSVFVAIAFQ